MVKKEPTISVDEFCRTRDSVVTGLTTLQNAVGDLLRAYLAHTNTVLSGGDASQQNLGTMAISNPLSAMTSGAPVPPAANAAPEEVKGKKKKEKKPKDPNAPKRPLTAYFLYLQSARSVIKNDLGEGATPKQVGDEATKRWHEMPEDDKEKWRAVYRDNHAVYLEEVKEYAASKGKDITEIVPDIHEEEDDAEALEAQLASDAAAAKPAEDTDEESEEEKEPTPAPAKEPTPPPTKRRKTKADAAKAAAPVPATTKKNTPVAPPPSAAKARETKEKSPEKKRKAKDTEVAAKEPSPEEPKKKRSRKSKGAEELEAEVETPAAAPKEKRTRKR